MRAGMVSVVLSLCCQMQWGGVDVSYANSLRRASHSLENCDSVLMADTILLSEHILAKDSVAYIDSLNIADESVFVGKKMSNLPELRVESQRNRLLHLLAYVREYSSLTTYTDTVFMFREKMVDFMIPVGKRVRLSGWKLPRVLSSRSYYHFTNANGLDSVSDECQHHFSWSDWVGLPPAMGVPKRLRKSGLQTMDTIKGKYSVAEVWLKGENEYNVEVDVLARKDRRGWIPELSSYFERGVEFDKLKLHYNFDNVLRDTVANTDLTRYEYDIESRGRGYTIFRFNKKDEPFFVSTHAEVYVMDREYLKVSEAREWERLNYDPELAEIWYPNDIAPLSAEILTLKDRVANICKGEVRLALITDKNIGSMHDSRKNYGIGSRIWNVIKDFSGISAYQGRQNRKKNWDRFRRDRLHRSK